MFFAAISTPPTDRITTIILAVGALGTAAYGLVDATKGFGGGVSTRGLAHLRKSLAPLLPVTVAVFAGSNLTPDAIFKTLKSNWINGVSADNQKAIAKSLIKLRMDVDSASTFAALTGVDLAVLKTVIGKMSTGTPLVPAETDTYARFDLVLTTMIDQAYQRADQQYRNTAKLVSVPVSIALAMLAAAAISNWNLAQAHLGIAFVLGLIATPLAPIAKDLSTAVQTAAKAIQAWRS